MWLKFVWLHIWRKKNKFGQDLHIQMHGQIEHGHQQSAKQIFVFSLKLDLSSLRLNSPTRPPLLVLTGFRCETHTRFSFNYNTGRILPTSLGPILSLIDNKLCILCFIQTQHPIVYNLHCYFWLSFTDNQSSRMLVVLLNMPFFNLAFHHFTMLVYYLASFCFHLDLFLTKEHY